ncbi:glycosyltransferase family 4 protein [Pseudomonadota bacterium]
MKIAIWHNLPSGGGKRALYYHVRGLVERGHCVEVWSPPLVDDTYMSLSTMAKEHVIPLEWSGPPNEMFVLKHLRKLRHFHYRMRGMEEHCRKCAEQIHEGNFDVFFGNTCLNLRAAPIGRYIKIPKVLYLQEPFRWLYECLPDQPWAAPDFPKKFWCKPSVWRTLAEDFVRMMNNRLQVREELRSVKSYEMVLVNSYFSRESLIRSYGINPKVCYLGVDTSLFKDDQTERENIVLGIGSFDYIKNIDFVIRAVALLSDLKPQVVWIGNSADPKYLKYLVDLAAELGVLFHPQQNISDRKLIKLLGRGRVLAYAPHLEPFGFAPIEANCCGLPVVAVAEGGVRETVVDGVTGLLVESDVNTMAAALRRLLEDPAYAAKLGRKGREIAFQRWSLSQSIDRLEHRLNQTMTLTKVQA